MDKFHALEREEALGHAEYEVCHARTPCHVGYEACNVDIICFQSPFLNARWSPQFRFGLRLHPSCLAPVLGNTRVWTYFRYFCGAFATIFVLYQSWVLFHALYQDHFAHSTLFHKHFSGAFTYITCLLTSSGSTSCIIVFGTDSVCVPGAQASSAAHQVVEAYLAHRLWTGASGMFLTPFW